MQDAKLIAEQRFRWLRFRTHVPKQFRAITHINVRDTDSGDSRHWHAAHVHFDYVAEDLLNAARLVLANWEQGELAGAVRQLAAVVERVDGGSQ